MCGQLQMSVSGCVSMSVSSFVQAVGLESESKNGCTLAQADKMCKNETAMSHVQHEPTFDVSLGLYACQYT